MKRLARCLFRFSKQNKHFSPTSDKGILDVVPGWTPMHQEGQKACGSSRCPSTWSSTVAGRGAWVLSHHPQTLPLAAGTKEFQWTSLVELLPHGVRKPCKQEKLAVETLHSQLTSCMNLRQTGRISLLRVALNIMTCFSWGVILKISCTSRLMSGARK